MTLTKNEYMWCITYESADDGHRVVDSYWTSQSDAINYNDSHAIGRRSAVIQCDLWTDGNGRWYAVSMRPVEVDRQARRASALAKLTPEEKRALGVA